MGLDLDMVGGDVLGLDWDLALAVWHTLLKCNDNTKGVLKEKAKEVRRKEKKAQKKSRKKGSQDDKGGRKSKMAYDSDSSSSESATSSSSSSSSDGEPHSSRKSHSQGSYERFFEDTKDAAATPPFVYVKGVPHFRSKTTGDLVNAGKPPNTPCRPCQNCHRYWLGAAYGCKGAALCKK